MVVDVVPQVALDVQVGSLQVLLVVRVATIERGKLQALGELNVHFGHAVDVKSGVGHFAKTQLAACGVENTILAVADEDGAGTSGDEDSAVFALIDLHLLGVIKHNQSAVLTIGNIVHLALNRSGQADQRLRLVHFVLERKERRHHIISPL